MEILTTVAFGPAPDQFLPDFLRALSFAGAPIVIGYFIVHTAFLPTRNMFRGVRDDVEFDPDWKRARANLATDESGTERGTPEAARMRHEGAGAKRLLLRTSPAFQKVRLMAVGIWTVAAVSGAAAFVWIVLPNFASR